MDGPNKQAKSAPNRDCFNGLGPVGSLVNNKPSSKAKRKLNYLKLLKVHGQKKQKRVLKYVL